MTVEMAYGATVRTDPVESRKGLLYLLQGGLQAFFRPFGLLETPCPYGQMSTRLQQVPCRNGYYKY